MDFEDVVWGILIILAVVFVIFIFVAAGYETGAGKVAEYSCIAQGYDTGEWIDGAIQCISHTVIGP